jgi:hypothetical protein
MASLREYYEKDFGHSTKLHIRVPYEGEQIEGVLLYDFASFTAFLALYVTGEGRNLDYFRNLLSSLSYGQTQFTLDGRVTLPSAKEFPGRLHIENKPEFEVLAQYFGDTEWISTKNIQASRRVFIYSDTHLTPAEAAELKMKAREAGHELQFRDEQFRVERSQFERPLAFICHDSRDK